MKTAILGYGKMGHEVERVLRARNHQVAAVIDNEDEWQKQWDEFLGCDVAIEFSMPTTAEVNLRRCFDNGIPVVSGTTGWHNRLAEVCSYCALKSGAFVYGTNFSIGVNLFFKAAAYLASQMASYPQYGVSVEEIHHIMKKDKPSGTAITVAETLLAQLGNLDGWVSDSQAEGKLAITSRREGDVNGIHTVCFSSAADVIELKHTAKSREGFATGAVLAAEWLMKNGGINDFRSIFDKLGN